MLTTYPNLFKSAYQQISPYVAGKDIEKLKHDYGLKHIIKLASNENPLGPSPKSIIAANQALVDSHYYPDSTAENLRQSLANKFNCSVEQIIIGAGSDSLVHILAQTFISPGDEAIIAQFAFASYKIAVLANQGKPKIIPAKHYAHDLTAMLKAIQSSTKMLFLANPNNPTGSYFDDDELIDFLKQIPPSVLVILDQAYAEYLPEPSNFHAKPAQLLKNYPNLVILRTFSKAYGLAGLRIGYGFADPQIIELLNRIRSPFTITRISLAAAEAALEDDAFITQTTKHNLAARAYFQSKLNQLGLEYLGQQGNFVCVKFGKGTAQRIFTTLLKKGIILRPLNYYQLDDYLRISLGQLNDLQTLVAELQVLL